MTRKQFLTVNGVRLAYLDFGGNGPSLLALHGHFSRGSTFSGLAEALADRWRVVALDQRGHGWSDARGDYSRRAYVDDAAEVIRSLNLAPVVVLGHSLGALNAYQLASWHPELVKGMIIEEIGAVLHGLPTFVGNWPTRFSTVRSLLDFLEKKGLGGDAYYLESLVEFEDGWGFRFHYDHMISSEHIIEGDWWSDWLSSTCLALLLHGHKSWVLTTEHAREMAARRPNTRLVEFPTCGHTIHDDDPMGFNRELERYLESM